jgi:hypothetical protein
LFLFRWKEVKVWKKHESDVLGARGPGGAGRRSVERVLGTRGPGGAAVFREVQLVYRELPASWATQPDGRWRRKRMRRHPFYGGRSGISSLKNMEIKHTAVKLLENNIFCLHKTKDKLYPLSAF